MCSARRTPFSRTAAHLDHVQVLPLCSRMQEGEPFVVLACCVRMKYIQEVLEALQLPFLGSKVHCICACKKSGGEGKGGGWHVHNYLMLQCRALVHTLDHLHQGNKMPTTCKQTTHTGMNVIRGTCITYSLTKTTQESTPSIQNE